MGTLDVLDVDVSFGRGANRTDAVAGVNMTIDSGTVLGLVGESGSGKSTLARAIVGLVPMAGGSVLLDGHDALKAGRGPRKIQMVFQDPASSLNPRMSIGESVGEPMRRSRSREEQAAKVAELLAMVGVDPERSPQRPQSFSGGQKQRIALARALAAEPSVIIADEITSALDVSVQGSVLNVVREVQRELGFSMLFISHDFAVVRYVSDAIGVMYQGRIVERSSTDSLVDAPMHPYTQALLASVPRLGVPATVALPTPMGSETSNATTGCPYVQRCDLHAELGPRGHRCLEIAPHLDANHRLHQASCHFVEETVR